MKRRRQFKRSRLLISLGVQFVFFCVVLVIVASLFNMMWLLETAGIVAILVAIYVLIEYWSIRQFRRR